MSHSQTEDKKKEKGDEEEAHSNGWVQYYGHVVVMAPYLIQIFHFLEIQFGVFEKMKHVISRKIRLLVFTYLLVTESLKF